MRRQQMMAVRHTGNGAGNAQHNIPPFNAALSDNLVTANRSNTDNTALAGLKPWYPVIEGTDPRKTKFNDTIMTMCANLHTNITTEVDRYLDAYSKSAEQLTNRQIKDKINAVLVDCVQSTCRIFSEAYGLHLKGINAGKVDTGDLGHGVSRFRTEYADAVARALGKKISAGIDSNLTDVGVEFAKPTPENL